MAALGALLTQIGSSAAMFVRRNPRVLLALVCGLIGAVFGVVIANFALLVGPMRLLFVVAYLGLVPCAVAVAERDRSLARALFVGSLTAMMGLLAFRVIYDVIGLEVGELRSNATGIFGIVCGVAGFLKARS